MYLTERESELFTDMAEAVWRGDLASAERDLDLLRTIKNDDQLLAAKRRARPLPPSAPLAVAEVFPKPGHLPGSFEGRPLLAKGAKAA